MVFATARAEFAESVIVPVVVVTGVAFGMSFTAVELLWQPRLADLLGGSGSHGVAFGGLGAAAMAAVAVGAALSARLNRRLGVRLGYVLRSRSPRSASPSGRLSPPRDSSWSTCWRTSGWDWPSRCTSSC